jgi:hypothetical protein
MSTVWDEFKLRAEPELAERLREYSRLTDRKLNDSLRRLVRIGLEQEGFGPDAAPSPGHSVKV